MKNLLKRFYAVVLIMVSIISSMFFASCNKIEEKVQSFYDTIVESKTHLDVVADTIDLYWYEAIQYDSFKGDVNLAVFYAKLDTKSELSKIEENDVIIQELYKEVRDSDLSTSIKSVMSAYSYYFECVMNVSGSYNTFSMRKESLKNSLTDILITFKLEI